jgi:hypothetical protein
MKHTKHRLPRPARYSDALMLLSFGLFLFCWTTFDVSDLVDLLPHGAISIDVAGLKLRLASSPR